jgi:hypothetical protein
VRRAAGWVRVIEEVAPEQRVVVRAAEIARRPLVVVSRDAAIPRLRRALVAPCTTTIRGLASEVVLELGEHPVPRRCAAKTERWVGDPHGAKWESYVELGDSSR